MTKMSKMQIFSVLITEIDKENGSISQMTVESTHRTKEEAYEAMHTIYLEELKKRGLEDNSVSDEEGNSGLCAGATAGMLFMCHPAHRSRHPSGQYRRPCLCGCSEAEN